MEQERFERSSDLPIHAVRDTALPRSYSRGFTATGSPPLCQPPITTRDSDKLLSQTELPFRE